MAVKITYFVHGTTLDNENNVAIVAHKAPQLAFDVLLKGKTWKQAFDEDWRKTKTWQPGWDFVIP